MVHETKNDGQRSMVTAMCGVQLKDKQAKYMMIMLSLNGTIAQLAIANNVCWHGHVMREDNN